jgi:hypothetical protein
MGWKIMSEEWVQYPRSHPQANKRQISQGSRLFSLTILQKGKYFAWIDEPKKNSQMGGGNIVNFKKHLQLLSM